MSPVHSASLVDSSLHSKQMLELLELRVGRSLINYIIQFTIGVVTQAHSSPSSSTQPTRPRKTAFSSFVSTVLTHSEAKLPVLLVALVYMARSRPFLAIDSDDYACERIFLGALMCASKYTNDATLRNAHWATITGMFGRRDVGRIEREFLEVLDWELRVSEADILVYYDAIIALYPEDPPSMHQPPHVSFAVSEDHASFDSDGSSSVLVTPNTPRPAHHPAYTKSPHPRHHHHDHHRHRHHHHIFHMPHLVSRHWRHSSHPQTRGKTSCLD